MTKDAAQIRRDFNKWPLAGVGVPTGRINNLIDIEADTPKGHGVDGLASLAKLEAELGPLPDTAMFESPSGSPHRLFNFPKDLGPEVRTTSAAGALAEGVDVKADGGMMIAPPSERAGGVYHWCKKLPIADLPEKWVKRLIELSSGTKHNGKDTGANGKETGPFEKWWLDDNASPAQKLNAAAMANLAAWVPELFPTACEYHGGYRVTSTDLGRDNEEDLSIVPGGIKDWGVHDLSDPVMANARQSIS